MTRTSSLLLRILSALMLAALLMLPTLVGALSQPFPAGADQTEQDGCADEDATAVDPEPELKLAPVCLELAPEQSVPGDGAEPPSAQQIRTARPERLRQEPA